MMSEFNFCFVFTKKCYPLKKDYEIIITEVSEYNDIYFRFQKVQVLSEFFVKPLL